MAPNKTKLSNVFVTKTTLFPKSVGAISSLINIFCSHFHSLFSLILQHLQLLTWLTYKKILKWILVVHYIVLCLLIKPESLEFLRTSKERNLRRPEGGMFSFSLGGVVSFSFSGLQQKNVKCK